MAPSTAGRPAFHDLEITAAETGLFLEIDILFFDIPVTTDTQVMIGFFEISVPADIFGLLG